MTIGIIFLFIGVAVAPNINFKVVKASNENDLVEVTSQACGIQGFENTTVKLTKQQYQNLDQYLVDFRARLNQTTTREEAIPIFKDAVVELNKYGLVPKGMSVEQAQRFVTIGYQIQYAPNILIKLNQSSINFVCLFTAILSGGYAVNIWTRIADWLILNALDALHSMNHYFIFVFSLVFAFIFAYIGLLKPLHFNNEIDVLGYPYTQFFFSIGLGGIKWGPHNISKVIGFTGLMILLNINDVFCLGFALDILD